MAENGYELRFAPDHLREDREVVTTAVAENGYALEHAADNLRGDREVVMTAVAKNGYALADATEELRGDKEIMEAALARASATIGYRPIGLKDRLKPTCIPTKTSLVCQRARNGPSSVWHAFFFFFARWPVWTLLVSFPFCLRQRRRKSPRASGALSAHVL